MAGGLQRSPTSGGGKRSALYGGALKKADGLGCCCAAPTEYIQAKQCPGGADVDIWIVHDPADDQFRFKNNGSTTVYYFTPHNNVSTTPGTAAGTITRVTTGCSTCFPESSTPDTYTVNLSGITPCPGSGIADPNGTYTVTRGPGTSCTYTYSNAAIVITVAFTSTTSTFRVSYAPEPTFKLFERGLGAQPVGTVGWTATNSLTTCGTPSTTIATGGTMTVTP